jgi:hypothetical protein
MLWVKSSSTRKSSRVNDDNFPQRSRSARGKIRGSARTVPSFLLVPNEKGGNRIPWKLGARVVENPEVVPLVSGRAERQRPKNIRLAEHFAARQQRFESPQPCGGRPLERLASKLFDRKREEKTQMSAAGEASFRKKDIASWRSPADRECLRVCTPSRQLTPDGRSHSRHALDREAGFLAPRWVDHVPAEYNRALELSHSPVTAA